MKKIFSIDRIEKNIAVCVSDDDIKLDVEKSKLGDMSVNDIFSAEYSNGDISEIIPMPDERDRRLKANRERLQRLFERSKNNNS